MIAESLRPDLDRRRAIDTTWLAAAIVPCAVSCLASVLWSTGSTDRAAHGLRVALFEQAGFTPWSNQWFAGHHLAGYGLFVQALSAWFGSAVVAIAAAVLTSVAFWRIVRHPTVAQSCTGWPLGAVVWFSLSASSSVWAGRTPFCVGFALAMWAVVAAVSVRRVTAAVLAAAAGLASPICAVFVAVAAVVWLGRDRDRMRTAIALLTGAAAVLGAGALLFPERGRYPFPVGSFCNIVATTVVVLMVVRRHRHLLHAGLAYLGLAAVLFVVPNPIGSIAERLGSLVAGPILLLVWRPTLALLLAVVAAVSAWQVRPLSFAWSTPHPSYDEAFFRPAADFLGDQPGVFRVEVVPLRSHAEADYLARSLPLARGWAGHVDRDRNPLFFDDTLSAETYLAWLEDEGIAYVALADAPIDTAGLDEAELIRSGLPYLLPVWSSDDWAIYAVRPRPAMADAGLEVVELTPDDVALVAAAPGSYELKVRFSPWFVVDGAACVSESDDGWTVVRTSSAGRIVVRAAWTWRAIVDRDGTC
jgi:hypothetical protein